MLCHVTSSAAREPSCASNGLTEFSDAQRRWLQITA
jgi:hypothetical protein